MKQKLLILLFLLQYSGLTAQPESAENQLLERLDSLRKTNSPARDFAELYYLTTLQARDYFQSSDTGFHAWIGRFLYSFSNLFFAAADSFHSGKPVPEVWQAYYADKSGSAIRHQFLGINAHINGDCWRALTLSGSALEFKQYYHAFFRFDQGLGKVYHLFYGAALTDKKFRRWHQLSFGLLRPAGRWLLRKWRIRQQKLAGFSLRQSPQTQQMESRIRAKRERINRLIMRHL